MGTTTNLGLTTYSTITDASSVLIYDYIDQVSGSIVTSNLSIIDTFAGNISASLTAISASLTTVETRSSNNHSAVIQIVGSTTDVDTSSGIFYFRAPSEINGMVLKRAQAFVNTAGTTNPTTIQVRNMTQFPSNDALNLAISIASGDTAGTIGTVDTAYDAVATDDQIKIYVTGESTTKAQGLQVVLEWGYE